MPRTQFQHSFDSSVHLIIQQDEEGLHAAREHYGDSWRAEGGFSAWFNIKRKIDRLVQLMNRPKPPGGHRYDLFEVIKAESSDHEEATLDAVRDLRRYLILAEAYLLEIGTELPMSRDNRWAAEQRVAKAIEHEVEPRPGVPDFHQADILEDRAIYHGLRHPRRGFTPEELRIMGVSNEDLGLQGPFGFDPAMDMA